MLLLGSAIVDIVLYMSFASNPWLTFIISLSRFTKEFFHNAYDYFCGNLTWEHALGNCAHSPHLSAAVGGALGSQVGASIGFCLGPLSMALGAAMGGAVGAVVGALFVQGASADRDLQYAHTFLGVSEKSSDAEVASAYRLKALALHPDKKGGSIKAFQLLQQHYEKVCASRLLKAPCGKPPWSTHAALKASHIMLRQD
mmetsp:Transcript_14125/g.33235  ORF Transcript_14125/g.33235 Transcript_14125/m.33235 type:complete len:199 (-) Transcript_14125:166-762(-)